MQTDIFGGVDTSTTQAMTEWTPIPAGEYIATIVDMKQQQNKAGTGGFVAVVYQITDGSQNDGRQYTSRLNLWNDNATAVDIAKRELRSMRDACGVAQTEGRPEAFIGKTVKIKLTVNARKDDATKMENRLARIEPASLVHSTQGNVHQMPAQSSGPTQPQTMQAAPSAPPAGTGAFPWQRRA